MEHLGALLLMYPRGRQFADDFPEIPAAIGRHLAEGTAAASAAAMIAADILHNLLRQLGDAEKKALLDDLLATDPAEAKAMAAGRLARNGLRAAEPASFAMALACVAIFMARRMTMEGTLRHEELRHLISAIEDALGADDAALMGALAT